MKAFYIGLKEAYGPKYRGLIQLCDHYGNTVLQETEEILERLSDHFNQLLNIPGELDEAAKTKIVQRPPVALLDDPPNMNKLMSAISSMHDRKAVGKDSILSDIWKHGGQKMTGCLYNTECVGHRDRTTRLEECKHCPIFKKGDRKVNEELSGTYLLSIVGKIISCILSAKFTYYPRGATGGSV